MACTALAVLGLIVFTAANDARGPAAGSGQPNVLRVENAAGATGSPVVLRIRDSADTYISAAARHKNYATSPRISASARPGEVKVGYLRFALPRFDPAALRSAHLVLTRDRHHLSGSVAVSKVGDRTWREHQVTAVTAPKVGSRIATAHTDRSTTSVSFDVTSAVRHARTVSFALTSLSRTSTARFRSHQAAVSQPVLVLTLGGAPTGGQTSPSTTPPSTPSSTSASTSASSTSASSSSASSSSAAPPSSSATSSAPTSSSAGLARPSCAVSAILVPACGRWWGVAPRQWTSTPVGQGVAELESMTQQPFDIVHRYHVNDQLFPTTAERAVALQPGHNRLLFLNWKPATDMTWAAVAAGGADARIDREASYIKSTFNHPFFLTIWHEPENDVNQTPGSGMTAKDYAAMFRHVVLRLRADGVDNAVTVMTYMSYLPWAEKAWRADLYPGSDVVDWVAVDSYGSGAPSGYLSGDFNTIMNRSSSTFPGFYNWATSSFPGKPIMLGEWGVFEDAAHPAGKVAFYNSVAKEIGNYPALKALVYFDMPNPPPSAALPGSTSPDSTPAALQAFEALRRDPAFDAPQVQYGPGGSVTG